MVFTKSKKDLQWETADHCYIHNKNVYVEI